MRKAPKWREKPKAEVSLQPAPPKPFHARCLADVEPEKVYWLWYPYIPSSKLTFLEGDPGLGKSWLTCALTTAIVNGETLPGQRKPLPPQKVLIASAEDGIADTIVPRLLAMNADLDRVFCIDEGFTLDKSGIRRLSHTMGKFAATIVFIDPLVAYLGGKVDLHRANEVREVTEGLARAAEENRCAVVAVRHLRKASSKNDLYKGIGSIDLTAACRSVLAVQKTKDGRPIVRHIKHNLSPKGKALFYRIAGGEPQDDGTYSDGSFEWEEAVVDETIDRTLATTRAKDRAIEFLHDFLIEGAQPAVSVKEAATAAGIAESTLQRAKKGVVVSEKDGKTGTWYWRLEGSEGTRAELPKD